MGGRNPAVVRTRQRDTCISARGPPDLRREIRENAVQNHDVREESARIDQYSRQFLSYFTEGHPADTADRTSLPQVVGGIFPRVGGARVSHFNAIG